MDLPSTELALFSSWNWSRRCTEVPSTFMTQLFFFDLEFCPLSNYEGNLKKGENIWGLGQFCFRTGSPTVVLAH